MSNRLGTPTSQILASGAITAAGRVMSFGKAVALASAVGVYVASATVGNRTVQVQIKDSAGNVCLRLPLNAAITAGQTVNIVASSGVTIANFATTPIIQTVPIPIDCPIPDGGSITIVDTANIDGAGDTVAINALLSF